MLTTEVIEAGHAMPQCMYKIKQGSPDGPEVRFANVGDTVYHMWMCPSDVYGILVHSCKVMDDQGKEYPVLDENG